MGHKYSHLQLLLMFYIELRSVLYHGLGVFTFLTSKSILNYTVGIWIPDTQNTETLKYRLKCKNLKDPTNHDWKLINIKKQFFSPVFRCHSNKIGSDLFPPFQCRTCPVFRWSTVFHVRLQNFNSVIPY